MEVKEVRLGLSIDVHDFETKGKHAIRFLQEHFGVSYEQTMTFGDNENDIGLMTAAGESFAVENAREPVKQAAKHICPDYTKQGVCQVLRKVLAAVNDPETKEQ